MIVNSNTCRSNPSDWQTSFLDLLPEIQARLQQAFRQRDAAAREEAIADATVHCLLAYVKLYEHGRRKQRPLRL